MKKKQERILVIVTALLMLVSAAVLFLTHRNVPFMMDDLWYFTVLWEDTPISSFGASCAARYGITTTGAAGA